MSRQSQLQFVLSNGRELVLVNPEMGHIMKMSGYHVTSTAEDSTIGGARSLQLTIRSSGHVEGGWMTRRQDLDRIMAGMFHADQLTIEELLALVHRKMEERRQ